MRGIEAQFLALQKGFNELIPQHLLKPFDQKELEVGHAGLGCEGLLCAGWSLPPGQAADEAAQSPQAWGPPWLQEPGTGLGDRGVGKPRAGLTRPVVHVVAGSPVQPWPISQGVPWLPLT